MNKENLAIFGQIIAKIHLRLDKIILLLGSQMTKNGQKSINAKRIIPLWSKFNTFSFFKDRVTVPKGTNPGVELCII